MHDYMIDLETLSTRHDAAILSIGACQFDIETGNIGDSFTRHVALDDNPLRGHISADTVKWWLRQDDAARMAIVENKNSRKLASCLFDLREFVLSHKETKVWSNGATFDLVIVRSALDMHGMMTPWQYWQERDTRTLVDMAERITGINTAKAATFNGVKHDALSDAIHQVGYISHAYNMIKKGQPA